MILNMHPGKRIKYLNEEPYTFTDIFQALHD